MTTITIQSNFQAQKVINMLKSDGVKFSSQNHAKPSPVTLQRILEAVSRYHKVPVEKIKQKTRKREIVYVRSHFIYIACDRVRGYSLKTIGGFVGGQHYSTAIHGRNLVREAFEGKTSNLPHNIQIKKDILAILELLS